MYERLKIVSLTANVDMAIEIAKTIGVEVLPTEVSHYADGEISFTGKKSFRGDNVYIIQSTCRPVNERLMELLLCIDACKRASAKSITCVIPYFGYSRQDRIARSGEPITAKVVASLFQTADIQKLITIDLHTQQIQGFFSCPVINIDTFELFGEYFVEYFAKVGVKESGVVVVAPDHGSALRARDLGSMFQNATIAFIDKRRPAPNKSEVINVVGDVKDKTCLIVDDIIDTCGTINNAYDALIAHGAKDVYVCASHAVFSNGKIKDEVKKIVCTDSIEKKIPGVEFVSVAKLIAKAIASK